MITLLNLINFSSEIDIVLLLELQSILVWIQNRYLNMNIKNKYFNLFPYSYFMWIWYTTYHINIHLNLYQNRCFSYDMYLNVNKTKKLYMYLSLYLYKTWICFTFNLYIYSHFAGISSISQIFYKLWKKVHLSMGKIIIRITTIQRWLEKLEQWWTMMKDNSKTVSCHQFNAWFLFG